MAKPAAAPARTPIPSPDFNALNGKVVVMDVDGKENSIRVEPKTKQITHKGGFGGYASWTVHAKAPNVAQLQNRAYPVFALMAVSSRQAPRRTSRSRSRTARAASRAPQRFSPSSTTRARPT